jgi:hypothetical protein
MQIEDITAARTTDALCDLLDAYCDREGLPLIDAEELLLRVMHQKEFLAAFCKRWDVVQSQEDFEQACRARGEQ